MDHRWQVTVCSKIVLFHFNASRFVHCDLLKCTLLVNTFKKVLANYLFRKGKIINRVCFFRFTCDNGFFLDGSEESRCIDDNDDDAEGVWDNPAPVCVQITCNPPHVDPLNGGVDCTAGNRIFSVCT